MKHVIKSHQGGFVRGGDFLIISILTCDIVWKSEKSYRMIDKTKLLGVLRCFGVAQSHTSSWPRNWAYCPCSNWWSQQIMRSLLESVTSQILHIHVERVTSCLSSFIKFQATYTSACISYLLYSVSFWVCQTETFIWSVRLCYTRIIYREIQNSNPLTLSYDATWLSIVNQCVFLYNLSKGSNPGFSGKQRLTCNILK